MLESDECTVTPVFVHADTEINISKHVTYYFGTHLHSSSTEVLIGDTFILYLSSDSVLCLNVYYQSSNAKTCGPMKSKIKSDELAQSLAHSSRNNVSSNRCGTFNHTVGLSISIPIVFLVGLRVLPRGHVQGMLTF